MFKIVLINFFICFVLTSVHAEPFLNEIKDGIDYDMMIQSPQGGNIQILRSVKILNVVKYLDREFLIIEIGGRRSLEKGIGCVAFDHVVGIFPSDSYKLE